VVSDDDAAGVDDSNFEAFLTHAGVSIPRMFGFVGTSQSKCSISRPGDAYASLSQRMGGALFDICAASWDAHFAQLTDAVQSLARTKVTLKRAPVTVVSVSLNGVSLPQDAFTVTGSEVGFALPPGETSNATFLIEYR